MCILLYVKLFWCSGIPYIYGQLEGGISALHTCAFCSMSNVFGVVVFQRCMVNWRRRALVYVHCAICETSGGVAVFHTSMVNCGVHLP